MRGTDFALLLFDAWCLLCQFNGPRIAKATVISVAELAKSLRVEQRRCERLCDVLKYSVTDLGPLG